MIKEEAKAAIGNKVTPKETTYKEPKYPATVKEGYKDVRINCLAHAIEMHKDRNDTSGLLPLAEEFEKWVNR